MKDFHQVNDFYSDGNEVDNDTYNTDKDLLGDTLNDEFKEKDQMQEDDFEQTELGQNYSQYRHELNYEPSHSNYGRSHMEPIRQVSVMERELTVTEGIYSNQNHFDDPPVHSNEAPSQYRLSAPTPSGDRPSDSDPVFLAPQIPPRFQPNTQAEIMSQVMTQGNAVGNTNNLQKVLSLTYYILKGQVENKLSVIPRKDFDTKYVKWIQLIKENNVDVKSTLDFIINAATEFRDNFKPETLKEQPIERGMEYAADVLIHGKRLVTSSDLLSSIPGPSSSKTSPSTPKKKRKSDGKSRPCRACKEMFVKANDDNWICDKPECQERKCTNCGKDRVVWFKKPRSGKCQKCNEEE